MRGSGLPKIDLSAVRGCRLLVALSGGADSVALLHLLEDARQEYALTLFAAHVDHGIRPDSAEDARFCRRLCDGLDIPFYCATVDALGEAEKNREGLETAARRLRYEALRRFARQARADFIVLAHHADDQAETVLMHLARGTGPEGICAMRAFSSDLFRPLLGWRKADLTAYLRDRGISWREDSTNRSADNPRNALRLHVMPELVKCYPQFAQSAARYAMSAQIESDCLDALTRDYLAKGGAIDAFCAWIELSDPPHRALLRRALRARCPGALSWEQINALEALCAQARGKIDFGHCYAERTGRRLYFVPKRLPPIEPAPLSLDGKTALAGICEVEAGPCAPVPIRDDPMREALDRQALAGAVLRTRRPGDRFRPLGCGDRLLSDYLTDRKLDRPLRDCVALAAKGGRVLWVCGLGISEDARLQGREGVELRCRYTFDMSFGSHK